MSLLAIGVRFEVVTCCNCGCTFAPPADMIVMRRQDGRVFYCPNGHELRYDSENEKLKKQVAQLSQKIDQKDAALRDERQQHQAAITSERAEHDTTRHRLRGTKAALTRTKNAVAAGKCPCCSAEFEDLAAHMTTTHPGYHQADESEESSPAAGG